MSTICYDAWCAQSETEALAVAGSRSRPIKITYAFTHTSQQAKPNHFRDGAGGDQRRIRPLGFSRKGRSEQSVAGLSQVPNECDIDSELIGEVHMGTAPKSHRTNTLHLV